MSRRIVLSAAAALVTMAMGAATVATPATGAEASGAVAAQAVANRTVYRPIGPAHVPPKVRARAWAVVDMTSGKVLGRHDARTRLPQASTIKLLTALTATHRLPATGPLRATARAAHTICSCAGVRAGRRYTRSMLFSGMLVKSGNDAAEAVAGADPHGRAHFIAAMNRTAARLGASDTVARNPSGLDQAGGHSSARDLVVLLREASTRPSIAGWLDTPSTRFGAIGGPRHLLTSLTDYLLIFPDSYAAKSGFTTRAGNTLTTATLINQHRIGVAILRAPAGFTTKGARKLTVWAANNFDLLGAVGRLPAS